MLSPFLRREYTVSLHLVDNSWRYYGRKSYLCTTCESRLHSLQNAQTSLASHSFALPLHIEKEVNFWMGKLSFSMTLENERWNGKNGGFFYRLEGEKRFSTVLSVRSS